MKFTYSVVRYVPDPGRGEYVNVGAIVGSELTSEWDVQQVGNTERARRLGSANTVSAALDFLTRVGDDIDAFASKVDTLFPSDIELSEQWLLRLYEEHQNIVQLSRPTPMVAESLGAAMDVVLNEFILEPAQRRFGFLKKHVALGALRQAYARRGILKGQLLAERVRLQTPNFHTQMDFAVANGVVAQLTQAWSFQLPDQDALAEQVKAWGWSVSELRQEGGRVELRTPQRSLVVPPDVDVRVVYVPPDQNRMAFDQARAVFERVGVEATPHLNPNPVAEAAERRLREQGVSLSNRLDT